MRRSHGPRRWQRPPLPSSSSGEPKTQPPTPNRRNRRRTNRRSSRRPRSPPRASSGRSTASAHTSRRTSVPPQVRRLRPTAAGVTAGVACGATFARPANAPPCVCTRRRPGERATARVGGAPLAGANRRDSASTRGCPLPFALWEQWHESQHPMPVPLQLSNADSKNIHHAVLAFPSQALWEQWHEWQRRLREHDYAPCTDAAGER